MEITQGNLQTVFTGLKATFAEAVQAAETQDIQRLMETVPSTTDAEQYPVNTLLGDLEEVLDEVTIVSIGRYVQSVPNRTFARIVQIKRNDVADDNVGVYRPGVRQLGRRAALYPLRLAVEALLTGFADPWIDGQAVFSAGHTWPGGQAWSNRHDLALDGTNFDTACRALEGRVGPDGSPLGLVPRVLVCGLELRATAEELVDIQFLANGASNRRYKRCDLMVLPRLGSSEAWFVMDNDPVRPMILQDREGPEFTAKDSPDDHEAFYNEIYAYKARRRCAVAILAPWLIQASAGA